MKALLVYPRKGSNLISWDIVLGLMGRRAVMAPLGLLTVASLLPADWEKRFIDMNVGDVADEDLGAADIVLIGANLGQRDSARDLVRRCRSLGVRTVVGGPLFTFVPQDFPEADHIILREAELNLPPFLEDLERGQPRRVYESDGTWADIRRSPIPDWRLINPADYAILGLQVTRGCPHFCEFCSVTSFLGRALRTKTGAQVAAELEALHDIGWRDEVFVVDDNFIADRDFVKREILPAFIDFQTRRKYPFLFRTQIPLSLADDRDLLDLMAEAGFNYVVIGIESPAAAGLRNIGKTMNAGRDMKADIRTIQARGFSVEGSFIVGLDGESAAVASEIVDFVRDSGLLLLRVYPLHAFEGTALYKRLEREGRVLPHNYARKVAIPQNIKYERGSREVLRDCVEVMDAVYAPGPFYERAGRFLSAARSAPRSARRADLKRVRSVLRILRTLGVKDKGRIRFWKLLLKTLFRRRELLPQFIQASFLAYGFMEYYVRGADLSPGLQPAEKGVERPPS
jgi:radical SAM superfamily enzyme YgiQ (UPF0313 family)